MNGVDRDVELRSIGAATSIVELHRAIMHTNGGLKRTRAMASTSFPIDPTTGAVVHHVVVYLSKRFKSKMLASPKQRSLSL